MRELTYVHSVNGSAPGVSLKRWLTQRNRVSIRLARTGDGRAGMIGTGSPPGTDGWKCQEGKEASPRQYALRRRREHPHGGSPPRTVRQHGAGRSLQRDSTGPRETYKLRRHADDHRADAWKRRQRKRPVRQHRTFSHKVIGCDIRSSIGQSPNRLI